MEGPKMEKNEFLDIFVEEATERLQNLEEGIISLDPKGGGFGEDIDALMREAHTLKGSARMVGLKEFGEVAHFLEDILSKIKKGEQKITPELKDLLLRGTEVLKQSLSSDDREVLLHFLEEFTDAEMEPEKKENEQKETPPAKEKQPRKNLNQGSFQLEKGTKTKTQKHAEFVKLPIEKVEKVTIQAEELYMKAQAISSEKAL